jgi:hypothetical protein
MLGVGDMLVGDVKHANNDKDQADNHRDKTILIFIKLMHLLILLHSSHTFAKNLYQLDILLIFFSVSGTLLR